MLAKQATIEEQLNLPTGYTKDWSMVRFKIEEARRTDDRVDVADSVIEEEESYKMLESFSLHLPDIRPFFAALNRHAVALVCRSKNEESIPVSSRS